MAADERDEGETEHSQPDDDTGAVTGLEVLLDLVTDVLEDALDIAVSAVPNEREAQAARASHLRQAGFDLIILADAYDVLLRRRGNE